ncbi:hypothetical protein [Schinkia azotoformans]|uniref:hypothetical protein n=1 Tax=Schinkia azotoformans TaxID=1454 RepID=UPI002DBB79A9|nr:hypothetical protein [Schinkia azotoformans]MEC1748075.1 hypothetical protein [Schinkia azotoformans]
MYGEKTNELFRTMNLFGTNDLASIEVLREEIREQKEAIKRGYDKDGNEINADEILPWGEDEFIVCKEGIFHWDWEIEDYEYYGQVNGYVQKKIVTMLKYVDMNFDSEYIHLNRGTSYLLDGEYISYDDQNQPMIMLAIKALGCVPISIPYDREKVQISQVDFAVVNLLDIEEIE